MGNNPSAKPLRHAQVNEPIGEYTGAINYAFFETEETGFRRRICVFSSAGGGFTINQAEKCIDTICAQESVDWQEVEFCDLQTHKGFGHPPGYYNFDRLQIGEKSRGHTRGFKGCNFVDEWRPHECPLSVFTTFRSVIGTFLTLDQVLDRNQPCYRNMSDAEYEDDCKASRKFVRWQDEWWEKYRTENRDKFHTPEQALAKGYRLVPWCSRVHGANEFDNPEHVVVDLTDSHLLGQTQTGRLSYDAFKRPDPISCWKKELDWY